LAQLAGLSPKEYLQAFDRTNLLHEFPGRYPKKNDDKWPTRYAGVAAAAMKPLLRDRTVVLVGRNVAEAFGYNRQCAFHMWFLDMRWDFRVAVVPHTSGRNCWYRKPGNEEVTREFWKELLKKV
jgi:hypothetical protein